MSVKLFNLAKTNPGSILVALGFTTPLGKLIPVKVVLVRTQGVNPRHWGRVTIDTATRIDKYIRSV